MTAREMKRQVREVLNGINIEELRALNETVSVDYCRRRLSECMITGESLEKALPFLILGIIQKGVKNEG